MKPTVGIIGGDGFIGRAVARALLLDGHGVRTMDDHSTPPAESPPPGAVAFPLDCRKAANLSAFMFGHDVEDRPKWIVYLVAKQGYGNDWSEFCDLTVRTAYTFFEAVPKTVTRIVLASSQSVYAQGLNVREIDAIGPISVYGLAKLQQEEAFFAFGYMAGIKVVALRYSIVLGPGQSDEGGVDNGILRNFWKRFRAGEAPVIDGDGKQVRDFVHVFDVARATKLALGSADELNGLALNVSGFPASVNEFARAFRRETGCLDPIVRGTSTRPGGNFSLTSSGEKMRALLGWKPRLTIEEQIRDFVNWKKGLENGESKKAEDRDPHVTG